MITILHGINIHLILKSENFQHLLNEKCLPRRGDYDQASDDQTMISPVHLHGNIMLFD